jgi:hypothetical protein
MFSFAFAALLWACIVGLACGQEPLRIGDEVFTFGEPTKAQPLSYTAGSVEAVASRQSLVTFLGCAARPINGAVTCRAESLTRYDAPVANFFIK